jgi:hypothetical protein
MGSITRSLSNNITTGGVILPAGITNDSVSAVTSFANASGGTLILLSTQTASNSATISFTTGLDSTYDAYEFHFINIHPSADDSYFQFNGSTDGGSNYNVTKTTTTFRIAHNEAGNDTGFGYSTGDDLSQSTAFQPLAHSGTIGNDNDQNLGATLRLFNLSSTTYVKHFIAESSSTHASDYIINTMIAGYMNTTSAVNAIQFKFASGNIDEGIIKLYGVKKS